MPYVTYIVEYHDSFQNVTKEVVCRSVKVMQEVHGLDLIKYYLLHNLHTTADHLLGHFLEGIMVLQDICHIWHNRVSLMDDKTPRCRAKQPLDTS